MKVGRKVVIISNVNDKRYLLYKASRTRQAQVSARRDRTSRTGKVRTHDQEERVYVSDAEASRPPSASSRAQKGCSEWTNETRPCKYSRSDLLVESQVLFTVGSARSAREGSLLPNCKWTHIIKRLLLYFAT